MVKATIFSAAAAALIGFAMATQAAATPTVRDLVEIVDLSGVAISPDGRSVAFREDRPSLARNRGDVRWYVTNLQDNGAAHPVADGGEAIWEDPGGIRPEIAVWSPDSRWIYYRALIDSQIQVWRSARDGSATEQVTHDEADVISFSLSQDGSTLTYAVGSGRDEIARAETLEYDQGIRIDGTIDPSQNLFRGGWINGRLATQRLTGAWFGRRGLLSGVPTRRRAVDLATLTTSATAEESITDVPDRSVPEDATSSAVSREGGWIAYVRPQQVGSVLSARPTAGDARPVTCSAEPCSGTRIVSLVWRPGRNELVFTTSDQANRQSLYLWDVERGEVRLLHRASGLMDAGKSLFTSSLPCAASANTLVCVAAAASSPPSLVAIDMDSGATRSLARPNQHVADRGFPPVEILEWQSPDGVQFAGQLFLPTLAIPGERAPLFITYYECSGYLKGGTGDEWPLATLAASGIAALCINLPASTVSVTAWDPVGAYDAALSGIATIIDSLNRRGLIDPQKVGMGGISFGSETTMWLARNSNLLAAASIASLQMSPTYYWFNGMPGRDNHSMVEAAWGLRSPEETPDRWRTVSPTYEIDRIRTPLLMQFPEQEYRTEMEFLTRLSMTSTPVEMFVFPDESHVKIQPRHKLAAYERNLDWFRFWLQDYVDPAPAKAEQYRRWRQLAHRQVEAVATMSSIVPE